MTTAPPLLLQPCSHNDDTHDDDDDDEEEEEKDEDNSSLGVDCGSCCLGNQDLTLSLSVISRKQNTAHRPRLC